MNLFNTNHNLLFKAMILALCVISFVHVFLFPLYDINTQRSNLKTYLELEQSLCTNNIKHRKSWRRTRCPQYGIVTIMQGGRLGNQMWEYASVWALGRRIGLESYVPRCIRMKLDQIFSSLTVPTFEEISQCTVDLTNFVRSLDAWNYTNQSIILPRYSIHPDLVLTWVQDIIQEFTIKKKLLDKSQEILNIAKQNNTSQNFTFVGVHIRRTDYINYLLTKHSAKPAGINYYLKAMNYFERKYPKVIFVLVSDDPLWCIKKFGHKVNVYISSRQHRHSPAQDLAILASCNHSIYDYGTFGEWGAILAGGETIYYNLTHHSSVRIGQILKNWRTI